MNNLFKLNENFNYNLPYNLLTLMSILCIICGIFVITSKNPIVSVLFLIGLFFSVASSLIILGMSFIGLSYLLVYVGAVSILFLFILMLINVRVSELTTDNNNSVPLSIIILTTFTVVFYDKVPSSPSLNLLYNKTISGLFNGHNNMNNIIYDDVSLVTSYSWDNILAENTHISAIGNILYTGYPMLLLITSIILLLAMVGAIVITIKQ